MGSLNTLQGALLIRLYSMYTYLYTQKDIIFTAVYIRDILINIHDCSHLNNYK